MYTDKKTNRTIYANLNQSVIRATLRSFDLYPTFLEVIKDTPEYTGYPWHSIRREPG